MEDGKNSNSSNSNTNNNNATTMTQQQHHQHLLLQQHQQQLYLLQQYHHQQQQHQPHNLQQQQQQQQQAISRFPSNIDAHLRSPGLRSLQLNSNTTTNNNPQQQQPPPQINPHHPSLQQQPIQPPPPQQQPKPSGSGIRGGQPQPQPQPQSLEVEMALQDAIKVCNPDIKQPFASIEDAVHRLLPYHVVSDFEAEEDDRILDSDTTGQVPSRLQQWDHNILAKIAEFTTTFEKQVLAFNIMSRKRALGEFRSEERLMLEQALLHEEKNAILELRAEMESREKAGRDAAEAKMRMAMAQAEHARAEAQAQAHAEMLARQPMRASALGSLADEGSGQDMGHEQGGNEEEMMNEWGNAQREEDDPSEDFLNDDNEPENGEARLQDEWREVGELDLNSR